MPVSADTICQSGVAYPVAMEIARQMNMGPGFGDAKRLVNNGIRPMPATELARQINTGVFSAHLLCINMWNSVLATVIKSVSSDAIQPPSGFIPTYYFLGF